MCFGSVRRSIEHEDQENRCWGSKVKSGHEAKADLKIEFEEVSSATFCLVDPGPSVAVRDKNHAVEFSGRSDRDEFKVAYEHFFKGFDKGEQKFEYQFRIGGVTPDMGWLTASGNVTGKKEGKEFAFPLDRTIR